MHRLGKNPSGYASAGRTLTLEECRELAIQNNKELKISGEKIKMAGYEKNAAFTKYFPQLSATGAYMWNQKDINLLDMGALGSSIGEAGESLEPVRWEVAMS